MADYEAISKAVSNAVKREVDKQIKAAYKRGYQKGYSEEYEARQSAVDIAYKRGLNDAWKCARKIGDASCTYLESMGFMNLEYRDRNASWDCVMKYSASEAIAKIKEYEEKQTEKHCENCECFGDITIDQAIYNLKRGYGIPHKHKTLTLAIKALEQKPKTGHWKNNKCDVCGASRPPLFDNYCPNCGADMRADKDCQTCVHSDETDGSNCYECIKGIKDNYEADKERDND